MDLQGVGAVVQCFGPWLICIKLVAHLLPYLAMSLESLVE